LIIIR